MSNNKNWFSTWFDTEYYHILYKNRDYSDAEFFLNNLINFLKPSKNSSILDLACGKGRHSIFLNKKGYNVTGTDLSPKSILEAQKSENENLHFQINDMRNELENNSFDYIFNMFTSFGYFEYNEYDQKLINSVSNMLKPNGIFVLDYLNIDKLLLNLIPFEIKPVDGIDFEIKRFLENGFVNKEIRFKDKGELHHFREQVKAFDQEDFKALFENSKLKIKHVFGDYSLNKYNPETSDRLIFVVQKPN